MDKTKQLIGHIFSDLSYNFEDIRVLSKYFNPKQAIEIQKETDKWDIKKDSKLIKGYSFISVHAPTKGVDLSSSLDSQKTSSLAKTIEAMDIAHNLEADVFVIHSTQHEDFVSYDERMLRRKIFLDVFERNLERHYLEHGHKYKINLENIEYSKYPATLEETLEISDLVSKKIPMGMTLDIPHIWNTVRILKENTDLRGSVKGYPLEERSFVDYVLNFYSKNKDKIDLIHLANFGYFPEKENPVRTHDPLSKETINPFLKEIIPELDKPIILEVHKNSISNIVDSLKLVGNISKNDK